MTAAALEGRCIVITGTGGGVSYVPEKERGSGLTRRMPLLALSTVRLSGYRAWALEEERDIRG